MSISVRCGECGKSYVVRDEAAGKRLTCKSCGSAIFVRPQDEAVDDFIEEADDEFTPSRSRSAPAPGRLRSRRGDKAKARQGGNSSLLYGGIAGAGVVVLLLVAFGLMRGGNGPANVPGAPAVAAAAPNSPAGEPAPAAATAMGEGTASTTDSTPAAATPAAAASPPATGSPASTPASNSPAPGSPARVAWQVQADPSIAAVQWPTGTNLVVPLASPLVQLAYPSLPSSLVAINLNSPQGSNAAIWDLATNRQFGKSPPKLPRGRAFALSPDGKYLALVGVSRRDPPQVWSFETGAQVPLDLPTKEIHAVDFVGPQQLLVWGEGPQYLLVDVAANSVTKTIPAPKPSRQRVLAFSPGGRYVAAASAEGELVVHELSTGASVGQVSLPDDGYSKENCLGIAFSPDGTAVACLMQHLKSAVVVVYDITSGSETKRFSVAGNLPLEIDRATSYDARALEWFPDGHGWLLLGCLVMEAESGHVVWEIPYWKTEVIPVTRRCLPMGVLVATGDQSRRTQIVPIDWKAIRASLAAAAGDTPAYMGLGRPVSLDVQVGTLLHGVAAETKDSLVGAFTRRLAADRISVAESSPDVAVLEVHYEETMGPTLQIRSLRPPASTIQVQSTIGTVKLAVKSPDRKTTYWSSEKQQLPGGGILRGEPTPANIRNDMFADLMENLDGCRLPIFIPRDSKLATLPGRTELK